MKTTAYRIEQKHSDMLKKALVKHKPAIAFKMLADRTGISVGAFRSHYYKYIKSQATIKKIKPRKAIEILRDVHVKNGTLELPNGIKISGEFTITYLTPTEERILKS